MGGDPLLSKFRMRNICFDFKADFRCCEGYKKEEAISGGPAKLKVPCR